MPGFEERIDSLYKEFESKYVSMTPKSRELFEKSQRVFPGGVTYAIRFFKPYPPYVSRAEGVRLWDVDGNVYVDFWMGHGTNILGHAPRFVVEAVHEASLKGTHFGFENPLAVDYAGFLSKIVPGLESLRFTNSGTEANMYAARLVRAYTGRKYIVKMEGGWHGGYDSLHTGVTPPFAGPESTGLLEDFVKYTIPVPFNDLNALEEALRRYPVAAVFIEPVLGAGGCIGPVEGYLKGVRELADKYGALLVFDEVITGFRLAPGGGQEYFNVRADIVIMGKIIGGGYPGAGAYGGRSDVMELVDHIKHPDPRRRAFHGGTFVGNPVTITAGYTTVKYLWDHRELYENANSLWGEMRKHIDKICESHGRLCWATGEGTMTGIHFTRVRPRSTREAYELRWSKKIEETFNMYARTKNILYISEKTAHLLPSLVHTREEAQKIIETLEELLGMITRT